MKLQVRSGQCSNAELWQVFFFFCQEEKKNNTKSGKEINSACAFLVWGLRVEQIPSSGMDSGYWSERSHSHRRVAKAGKQPRRDPGKRLTPH